MTASERRARRESRSIGTGGAALALGLALLAAPRLDAQCGHPHPAPGTTPAAAPGSAAGLGLGATPLGALTGSGSGLLPGLPTNRADTWTTLAQMPKNLGEVAAACIGDVIYVIGEGAVDTVTLTLGPMSWSSSAAADRPYAGNHQCAEVWGGRLYLIGGFSNGAQGKVQIYDPIADAWSEGAPMPWNGGSASSALIGGKIYVAGGIVRNSFTTDECGIYDPATDTWSVMAAMPDGRNHAAAATDGQRLWIFGGRGPGSGDTNTVANGFADVQVYDPATDTWESSQDSGSPLQPLPIGRGGMGKAIFHQGEFYVIGGETLTGPGAEPGNVYDRVDVYCPVTHTWRLETEMPTPRHGIHPVRIGRDVFVLGGGTHAGNSQSKVAEVLHLR